MVNSSENNDCKATWDLCSFQIPRTVSFWQLAVYFWGIRHIPTTEWCETTLYHPASGAAEWFVQVVKRAVRTGLQERILHVLTNCFATVSCYSSSYHWSLSQLLTTKTNSMDSFRLVEASNVLEVIKRDKGNSMISIVGHASSCVTEGLGQENAKWTLMDSWNCLRVV